MNRNLLLLMLLALLIGTLNLASRVEKVKASGTTYIRADGSIDPPTANIASADNVTYIFTGNVDDSIVVERDNVTVDGAGYTLQKPGSDIGISLPYRTNVTIQHVVIMGFGVGIEVFFSNRCVLYGNRIEGTNYGPGIYVSNSGYNKIDGNNASNNQQGISITHSSNNNIIANNTFNNNSGSDSSSGFGISLGDRCSNNVIINNTVNYNGHDGVGVTSEGTDGNVIDGNTIVGNSGSIELWGNSSSNIVYHNNFVNNTNQASGGDSLNVWDDGYPSGGNYWSDYSGVDMNHDGIGDASYVIGSERLQRDHYPLMGMFSSFNATSDFNVDVASNSTIHDFQYFQSNSTITMSVFNMTTAQSTGFCRVCIPHELINVTGIQVIIDNNAIQVLYPNYTLFDNGTHRWIYFAYEHSTHKVDIIPEFSFFIILSLLMTTTLVPAAIRKRRQLT